MAKYDTVVINLFGGAGIGKTTTANRLVGSLKMEDTDAVYIPEYVKELIYKANSDRILPQDKEIALKLLDGSLYSQGCVFSRQKEMLDIHVDQVPVIVTDSPLPLNLIYLKDDSEAYARDVMRCFNDEYINLNIVLERDANATYQTEGRIHTKEESIEKDKEILEFLKKHHVSYVRFPVNDIESMLGYIRAGISSSKGIGIESQFAITEYELDSSCAYIESKVQDGEIMLITLGDDETNNRFEVRHIPCTDVNKVFYKAAANFDSTYQHFIDNYEPELVVRGTEGWKKLSSSIKQKVNEGTVISCAKGKDSAQEIIRIGNSLMNRAVRVEQSDKVAGKNVSREEPR